MAAASLLLLSTALRPALVSRPPNLPAIARCPPPLLAASPPPRSPLLNPEVSLGVGVAILLLLVTNRLFTEDLLNSQSRADLLAAVAPALIVLKALGDLDITPKEAEAVPLDGAPTAWVEPGLPDAARRELEWAADSLFATTPCAALALWRDGRTLLLRGTLPSRVAAAPAGAVVPGPLLSKTMTKKSGAPDSLPSLQLLPGRVEFGYFPAATQGVLMVPLGGGVPGALVLGADRKLAFKDDDVAWARAVATRCGEALSVT